jgi:hypothetical protein
MRLVITVDTELLDPDEVLVEVARQTFATLGLKDLTPLDVENLKAMAAVAAL